MTRSGYDEVLELLKQGAVVAAQEKFNAFHESALTHSKDNAQPLERIRVSDGIACYLVENGKKSGPFCQRCYEMDSGLVRLRALDLATYVCPICKIESARNLCG